MSDDPDVFIVHRLRAKPVTYTVTIRHFVAAGEWHMGISINDIAEMDAEQKARIASDLRWAAELVEESEWVPQ